VEDLGLKVVRAVIPGYHPLVMGHRLRALGGKRLWTIPQKLGFKGITTEIGDNPYAHPYP
jgi:ribosomal protein S12 methylthiotransferase accessory factor